MSLHDNRISVLIFLAYLCLISHSHVYVFRISCKDLKSMLGQVNYRVPNMRFLREKLPVTFFRISIFIGTHYAHFSLYLPISFFTSVPVKVCDLFLTTFMTIPPSSCLSQDSELRNGDVSFSQFAQLYRSLMFDAQKNVSVEVLYVENWSIAVLSSPITPSDAPQRHPPPPICLFSNDCIINMKKAT